MAKYQQRLKEITDPVQFIDIQSKDERLSGIRPYHMDDGKRLCEKCGLALSLHGVVDRDAGWGTVCPGTWRVTHSDGTIEEMTDAKFQAEFEVSKET